MARVCLIIIKSSLMNKKTSFAILSALLLSAGALGGLCSCSLSKANEKLPVVKDSTALFDYFTYKGDDDFIRKIHCLMMSLFIILFYPAGIQTPVYVLMGKVIIFSNFYFYLFSGCAHIP